MYKLQNREKRSFLYTRHETAWKHVVHAPMHKKNCVDNVFKNLTISLTFCAKINEFEKEQRNLCLPLFLATYRYLPQKTVGFFFLNLLIPCSSCQKLSVNLNCFFHRCICFALFDHWECTLHIAQYTVETVNLYQIFTY